ncbi:MAG TPA: TRAP transporter fused permease subunit [Burkholderiales bacterium]|jgi:TRAP transporter 4TM/12TM fusion protein|nr:TRAP transporter fused permease subunit [Burkholderiales bacterium]
MSENNRPREVDPVVSDEALKKAEEYIEEEEGAINKLPGALGVFTTTLAVIMSVFHLYAAYGIMPTHVLRGIHVAFILFLGFLLFPVTKRFRHRVCWWDWLAALTSLVIVCNMLFGGDAFLERAIDPGTWDKILGAALIVLVLEAARRTSGWIMPFICVMFLVYAVVGQYLPPPWTHYGMDLGRIVGHMYMTLEGIFGVAIDVSSSLIILFTIYGAFLQYSGAGKFFIDFSFAAMGGKPTGAGRTIVLASFLLGGPSGSGVATTVTLGSVAYPMLVKAGYGKDAAGGLLAAGGLGAIISPPVLGAAAFLIAQFLNISYLDVILMATIPTLLYYFALFLMVEIDARKFGMPNVIIEKHATIGVLTRNYWFHFLSLIAIIFFMVIGFSPTVSVFWATVVAFVFSFLHVDCALIPYDVLRGKRPLGSGLWNSGLVKALEAGSVGMLSVGATCAAAGIIVGVVTLTGLGLKFSSIVLQYADSGTRVIMSGLGAVGFEQTASLLHDVKLLLTAMMTSLIVWIVGLAVPVTASYIICAVIAAPALIQLGVAGYAAHMFIFYYAVLSEVSPPTALSPFAAAAITGGDPYKTTLQSWKYTMPAFLVPFMFVLDPAGLGLLLMGSFKNLAQAPWGEIAVVSITAMIGIAALAAGVQNWLLGKTTWPERWLLIIAGLALMYPKPFLDYVGIALIVVAVVIHKLRRGKIHAAA